MERSQAVDPDALARMATAIRDADAGSQAELIASLLRNAGARVRIDMEGPRIVLAELGGAQGPIYTIQLHGHTGGHGPTSMHEALATMVEAVRVLAEEGVVGRTQRLFVTIQESFDEPEAAIRDLVGRNLYGDALLSGCTCHLPRRTVIGPRVIVPDGTPADDPLLQAIARACGWADAPAPALETPAGTTFLSEFAARARVPGVAWENRSGPSDGTAADPADLAQGAGAWALTAFHYLEMITD
jgi:hypothetical protein